MSPEQRMWQTVIIKALTDATAGGMSRRDDRRAEIEAESWLRSGGRDFFIVCTLAGFDPHFIREKYIAGRIDGALLRAKERTEAA